MSRFYFVHEDPEPYSRVSVETDAFTLPEVLKHIENFLRGVGYYIDGNLEVVPWDPPQTIEQINEEFLNALERTNNENSL